MAAGFCYGKGNKLNATVCSQDSKDYYKLDKEKSDGENCFDIYTELCSSDTSDKKRLYLLNGLATLCQRQAQLNKKRISLGGVIYAIGYRNYLGFSTEELLYCLSASLIHTFVQVRAAALRAMRFVLNTVNDLKVFNSMQLPYLMCRSIDIVLKNDDERVQALKLIRKMFAISAENTSPVLVRCLVSLADTGIEENDNMLRASLAILCELAVLNPTLLICCGGVTCITRNVLECHNPRIAESLSGVLLYLLEWPQTRTISGVSLDCLAAPYCDYTYRLGTMDKNKDARELRYTSCRLALLSVLRSWTGTIEFCDPSKPSCLKAIVDALYLNEIEVRKAILELLYELLGLPQPLWTEDYVVALHAVDPSDFQDNWLLINGFVAAEGRSILPSLASRAPNICEQHLALQLYCFLETGLLNALVQVVVSSEIAVSVATTVLIGKVLHLMHTHLPADICSTFATLPSLIAHATKGNQRASAAISALQRYQKMLRNRPASTSLFLDTIIQEGSLINTRLFKREINIMSNTASVASPTATRTNTGIGQIQPIGGTLDKKRLDSVSSSEDSNSQSSYTRRASFRLKNTFLPFLSTYKVSRLIRDSNVLDAIDGTGWDWELISTIIRCNLIQKWEEQTLQFFKNIIGYFKPSQRHFSQLELVHGKSLPACVKVGLDFIEWLLPIDILESLRLLTDFFTDIATQLLAVLNHPNDCIFSPEHMKSTMCQQYFLFIGRMCRSQKGIHILTNTTVFEHLTNLVRNADHTSYVKLIVSGLDYKSSVKSRRVLDNALTSAKSINGRLYATQFLLVLLRSRIPGFEVWGILLIIQQTKDHDRSVALAALDILEEACHEKCYLEEIVLRWPYLKSLGDSGCILMSRYYSIPRGLNHRKARIKEEIEFWKKCYNKRYVLLVEADTHSSLTLHIRNEAGYYSRRNCNTRPIIIPPNIPAHLYGQLVQTTQGTTALRNSGDLRNLIGVICSAKCSDETECLELKAALWAIAHASTHSNGIKYFLKLEPRIYEKFICLAKNCKVYSIRATSFNCLGVIGNTIEGANTLFKFNWLCVRHDRNTLWPVHQSEEWMLGNYSTPLRHHYENMPPPYNYTGLDDQIDGSYDTRSYWNLMLNNTSTNRDVVEAACSEAQDATTTDSIKTSGEEMFSSKQVGSVSISVGGTSVSGSVSGNIMASSTKSKTLPEGSYLRHFKHQRSLSESKTTDVISLLSSGTSGILPASSAGFHYPHRTRYNSNTDSNTSGVSSCESVTGKAAAMGDFQQCPLSPIPSMSNLMEIPLAKSSLQHRTSVRSSYSQNGISSVDIKGYAQFRSLRRHCRPVLSESSTDLYDIVDGNDLLSSSSFRPRILSYGDSHRKTKVRSLDRQSSLRMYAHLNTKELQVPLPSLNPPKFLAQNDSKGPCYAGICLPKDLRDMFPTPTLSQTYVSQDMQDQDLMDINLLTSEQQSLTDSLNNEGGDESPVISSTPDGSSVSKDSKLKGAKPLPTKCLHCCRFLKTQRLQNQPPLDGGGGDLSATTSLCELYTNTSAALAAAGIEATDALCRKYGGSTVAAPSNKLPEQHQQQQQQLSESPESILIEDGLPDKLILNILYNVLRLANPVCGKQAKMALLELKQKHPSLFQDICLYSAVCRNLGHCNYRMHSRRFLQELFFDLDFKAFYDEPLHIISTKDRESFKSLECKDTEISSDNTSLPMERMSSISRLDDNQIDSRVESLQSGSTGSSNVIVGGSQGLKTHIKSQPLASVCEASCENLVLDQSMATSPLSNVYNTELRITTDEEDEEDGGDDNLRSPQKQKQQLCDEVDSTAVHSSCSVNNPDPVTSDTTHSTHSTTASTSKNSYLKNGGSVDPPISGSDQTTASNPSSTYTLNQ